MLVALTILVIALGVLGGQLSTGIQMTGQAEQQVRASQFADRIMSLVELDRNDCRYPYGGEEEGEAITFCGRPRRKGSSYCTPHFHLARDPGIPPERTVGDARLKLVEPDEIF